MKDLRLALDVGTRTLAAAAYRTVAGGVEVVGLETAEHAGRPMRDGAVEDVEAVAAAARSLIDRLGLAADVPAVAAVAGRALAARRGRAGRRLDPPRDVGAGDVAALAAVAAARAAADGPPGLAHVGTVTVGARADGADVGRLEGRRAAEIEVEVVATFLPAAAVEAKARALEAAGARLVGLLLEPIAVLGALGASGTAAGDVALVDVGAGTTDLAVVRPGGAADFRAIGIAGDEATEAVGAAFRLGFREAERAKRAAASGEWSEVVDALGERRTIDPRDVAPILADEAARLAGAVAAKVREVSGRVRAAVLVGGGALLPGLDAALARALDLPADAVRIRPAETVEGVTDRTGRLRGAALTTVAAIAVSAPRALLPASWEVEVPHDAGRPVRRVFALSAPEGRTAAEILVAAGVRPEDLEGAPGRSIAAVVGGRVEIFAGTPGAPPRLSAGGAEASLEDLVPPGRRLVARRGRDGADASATVGDALAAAGVAAPAPWRVVLDGRPVEVPDGRPALRNGRPAPLDERLADGDAVEVPPARPTRTLAEVVARAVWRAAPAARLDVRLEGAPAPLSAAVRAGAVVEVRWT